ncbi:MAG: PilX N-terminal domain-containing pilus assembly protein [Thermoanaerobaculia bacterium]|nr:PilX N-terminal domain-containing pilus assembly protein [Thermoanaerobaculia bacterium]
MPRIQSRGSALVSVILVLLVLTIVGVGIAYFTSMEDRLSGNTRIAKAGFYAADAGLRRGEALLNKVINMPPATCAPPTLSQLLAARTAATNLKVPGGGYDALVLDFTPFDNSAACLNGDARAYANVVIPPPAAVTVVDRVTYTLFLRNNVDDAVGSDVADNDNIVNLVSVGTVQLAAGLSVTKIIEEQLLLSAGCGSTGNQKGLSPSGQNTVGGCS